MKRDFTNESWFNILLRLMRAIMIRFRGLLYTFFKVFHNDSSYKVSFGSNPRFLNSKWIFLSSNVGFSDYCRLECYKSSDYDSSQPKISIGSNSSFGELAHIGAINQIIIGDNVLAGSKVLIIDHDHGNAKESIIDDEIVAPRDRKLFSKGPIVIGNNVWIGEGVIILSGSQIGDGAIIAANSIVKGNVASNTIYFNSLKK